ncbi:MAG TPA: YiiX/YebB-like N1pC/P60 family cysteine hydrolase [Syntrophobacteraceae bacterium]|nr:YiiX/YebB-like N1pC/P60 family cysteine hydrolase [Syntrophobacteraceae bacterium]
MVYSFEINGLLLKTGDLICTVDGGEPVVPGEFWRLVGKLIPGEVDHIVIYVGPDGRCVEAGAKGVIAFAATSVWDSAGMLAQRLLVDQLYGVAYPLSGRPLAPGQEETIRENVAAYCLAQVGKPYNINFLDSSTEDSFYCSQLAYEAYLKNGIDLNSGKGVPAIPGTSSIIFPQELWEGCVHEQPAIKFPA